MFFVFSYPDYYPTGGQGDLVGAFHTFEEAEVRAREQHHTLNVEILNGETGEWTMIEVEPPRMTVKDPQP